MTGVPAAAIRELAHAYARAERAQLCWTLGITEHHNGTDNVRALINLSLLTGHVGRYGSGVQPLRGQNNVQGGGDMGAIPNRLPGFQDILDAGHAAEVRVGLGHGHPAALRPEPDRDVRGDGGRRRCRAVYCIGENPAQSEADSEQAVRRLRRSTTWSCRTSSSPRRPSWPTWSCPRPPPGRRRTARPPTANGGFSAYARPSTPPGEAREDIDIICDLAGRLGHDWKFADSEAVWNELRVAVAGPLRDDVRPAGGAPGHPVAVPRHGRARTDATCTAGCGRRTRHGAARSRPSGSSQHDPPVDLTDEAYPIRLTTGRRLDSYNTGVQSGSFASPLRRGEYIELCPEDAERYGVVVGEEVRIASRRGAVTAPVWVDPALRPGLAFMTMHFPDEVDTNQLTIEANCPIAGTAEFKASAIRIEKLPVATVVR